MKYCIHCGEQLSEGAVFCVKCGAKQDGTVPPAASLNFQQEKIQKHAKNYGTFLLSNIKQPKFTGEKEESIHGLISYIIITVLMALSISRFISIFLSAILSEQQTFPFVFQLIIGLAVLLLAYNLIVFGISNALYKNKLSFLDSFTAVYGPASIVVPLALLLLLVSFLRTKTMIPIIILVQVIFIVLGIASIIKLWGIEDQSGKKINRFYIVLGATAIFILYNYLFFRVTGDFLVSNLDIDSILLRFIEDMLF